MKNEMVERMMVERMARLETDVSYIKKSIDSTNNKLDKFVEAVDKKYANKSIEYKVKEHDKAIHNINITIAKWVGGSIALTTIITWILSASL